MTNDSLIDKPPSQRSREAFEAWYYKRTHPRAIGAEDDHWEARWDAWQSAWQHQQAIIDRLEGENKRNAVILETFRKMEVWVEKFETWACSCAQLLDGWHQDGTAWSEWDESVRKELLELQLSISALAPYLKPPSIPGEQTDKGE